MRSRGPSLGSSSFISTVPELETGASAGDPPDSSASPPGTAGADEGGHRERTGRFHPDRPGAQRRRRSGSKGGKVFRAADDPNSITIIFEWDDTDRAREFAESLELHEAMQVDEQRRHAERHRPRARDGLG